MGWTFHNFKKLHLKKGYGNCKRQVALHSEQQSVAFQYNSNDVFHKKKSYQIQDPQGKSQQHQL